MRLFHLHRVVAVVTVALLAAGLASADAPVAPSPDPLVVDGGVEPAALTTAAPSSALPLPLDGPSSAAPRVAPPRPLPDWRVLVALGGAFAALAQSVRIVRFGPRTLLLSVSASGCQTLAELADPQATDAIVAACRGVRVAAGADRRPGRRETRA